MQFLLANPAWLWLLALGTVPLLVHLFARSNPPRFAFSSTAFLQKIMKKTARLRKPQDWLLLLLRTLAVLALLFVFLQPLLTGANSAVTGKKTTIFLVDRSASMAAKDGAESRFAEACAKAGELLAAGSADAANVVWIDAEPDALFPQPGPNLDYLREALKRTGVRMESGAISGALQLAISQLEQVQGERRLVILSDFQAAAWRDTPLNLPTGIAVEKVRIGATDLSNVAVHELFATPSEPVVGQDTLMVCRLRNYSGTPRRTTLYLESDGGRRSRDVEMPAWGEAELNFSTRFSHAGQVAFSASIAEDAFPGDDRRYGLVRARETLKLVSVAPPEDSLHAQGTQVLRHLADSLKWLECLDLPPSELPAPGAADFLFLHSWDGTQINDLQALSRTGTTLIVQPAVGCSLQACQQLMGLEVGEDAGTIPVDTKSGRGSEDSPTTPAGWQAGIAAAAGEDAPVFALFKSGEFGNPSAGIFLQRSRLPREWPEEVQRLIDYQDGVPGMLSIREKNQGGSIILWNLPVAERLSSWSAQTPFLPFFA
ncbi:MAG: BatA and WFA domain-containing protein [Verrucomicrobia bacterium]|nr:BatA and WFA domain-containing protein [Verrucomicrobiota bacterium]